MEYTKVNLILFPDTELTREILIAELGNIGYESFTESDLLIEAFIPTSDFQKEDLIGLSEQNPSSFQFKFTSEVIPDQNWNEIWEKNYFKPLLIAERCLIRAPFHTEYPNAEFEIIIEPGMAFGTGNHETTNLMISEILGEDVKGKTVLDMGCGTGILSILVSKMGANKITSIDIDSWAIKSTKENATNNNITNLEVIQGGAEVIPDKKFDFIYANIQRNILLMDLPQYYKALNKNGELIMSGFYETDFDSIKGRALELGLHFKKISNNEKWIATVFTLK